MPNALANVCQHLSLSITLIPRIKEQSLQGCWAFLPGPMGPEFAKAGEVYTVHSLYPPKSEPSPRCYLRKGGDTCSLPWGHHSSRDALPLPAFCPHVFNSPTSIFPLPWQDGLAPSVTEGKSKCSYGRMSNKCNWVIAEKLLLG